MDVSVNAPLDAQALAQLFLDARSFSGPATVWTDRPVSEDTLRRLYDLARLPPTAANTNPARIVFVTSPEAKATLREALDPGNVPSSMAAPVTAIIGSDLAFADKLPYLFPHTDARPWFADPAVAEVTAFRNGTLQGAYLILAARALGLDCGPMGGFNADRLDAAFFPGGRVRTNFIVNLGYGNREALFPRNPRLPFDEACRIV